MRRIVVTFPVFLSAFFLTACSLFDSEVPVRDLAYDVRSEIAWNAEHMAYTLRLSLESGEDGDYIFSYIIDEDPLTRLSDSGGSGIESGTAIPLSGKNALVLILPSLPSDSEHTLTMEFSRAGATRSYRLELPDTNRNGIGIRIDTDASLDYSRVILTNLMGASVTTYNVTFYLDGEILTGIKYMSNTFNGMMDIDFAQSESYTFEFPYLVAGEHILQVNVRSRLGSESTRLPFTEPQRRQTALTFSYNAFSGMLMLESGYNPLKTAFDITVDITVRGYIIYRPPQFFGIAEPKIETFTMKGETTARVTPGITATAFDSGKLKSLMDEVYANTREDASNLIGDANKRTLHTDIQSLSLEFTIHSLGDHAGNTVVSIHPATGTDFPVLYTYVEATWQQKKGTSTTLHPIFTVNGEEPMKVRIL